ncbi:MAG: tail fiber domain-containing protein [Bacteroidota bacterium]
MKLPLLLSGFLFLKGPAVSFSQNNVGINNDGSAPAATAILDIKSTSKGVLLPRLNLSQRTGILSPATGLLVFATDLNRLLQYNGSKWISVGSGAISPMIADADTNTYVHTEKLNNENVIRFGINGTERWIMSRNSFAPANTGNSVYIGEGSGQEDFLPNGFNVALGNLALRAVKTGLQNVAIGFQSQYSDSVGSENVSLGASSLFSNKSASRNVAIGTGSLANHVRNDGITAIGFQSLYKDTSGNENIAVGDRSSYSNKDGSSNIAIGSHSLYGNISGNYNLAIGNHALFMQSFNPGVQWTGFNLAIGDFALYSNQPTSIHNGTRNLAIGYSALHDNTTGSLNIAIGTGALSTNTTGVSNMAIGASALFANTTGGNNMAVGISALNANTVGYLNTAVGSFALSANTTGIINTALGYASMRLNTKGDGNTMIGFNSGENNTNMSYNVALGENALASQSFSNGGTAFSSFNVAIGNKALFSNQPSNASNGVTNTVVGGEAMFNNTTGFNNTAVGFHAGNIIPGAFNCTYLGSNTASNGSYNNSVALGHLATITAEHQVRVGNGFTGSIGGNVAWTTLSDVRFKKDIRPDVPGLAFINKLQPITYSINRKAMAEFLGRQDTTLENSPTTLYRTTGFSAQQVEQAAIETGYEFSGVDKPKNDKDYYGLRYAEFTVPLVKAVQEQQLMIEDLKRQLAELKAAFWLTTSRQQANN